MDKKIYILPYIIAFYRDNDLKLEFGRVEKVNILTKEANAKKKLNQSQKNFGMKKAYFWGHPVIHAVEAKTLGPFYKKFMF